MTLYRLTRPLRFWWQRRTRGFDDSELWSLDYTLAVWIVPRLKRFKKVMNGYPADTTWVKWQLEIERMIAAFVLIQQHNDGVVDLDSDDKARAELDAGLALFAKRLRHLWW